jgi:hypothetical protein
MAQAFNAWIVVLAVIGLGYLIDDIFLKERR